MTPEELIEKLQFECGVDFRGSRHEVAVGIVAAAMKPEQVLPSAADLDAVAAEDKAKKATAKK